MQKNKKTEEETAISACEQRIAFVCPRLHESGTVGGAETLLYSLARDAAAAGCDVTFLTTCARNHFTWQNEAPPGRIQRDGMTIIRFPVDENRDCDIFHNLQAALSRGEQLSAEQEEDWLQHGVNSPDLLEYLQGNTDNFERIIAGPYLFSLIVTVALAFPDKTLLVPCLHDEPFARVRSVASMFRSVLGCLFNTEPERQLARRLYPGLTPAVDKVVGMGIPVFETRAEVFLRKHAITAPYIIYCGRREPLKGTPLLIDYLATFRARTGRDVRLVLTGSGAVDLPPEMQSVTLDLGFVSEEEKHSAMAGAVVFCHPSVNESLSIVLIESWLAGTPALVHSGGDVLPWQCRKSQGGLWFGNYPEFEEALSLLLDNPGMRETLAANGRDYALQTYSPAAVLARFLSALTAQT